MLKHLLLWILITTAEPAVLQAGAAEGDNSAECVILLHGLGRNAGSMSKIEVHLNQAAYAVWNQSYPSTSEQVKPLANKTIEQALTYCREQKASSIHFVTHSLGGILVRAYLQDHQVSELGKIVMISPPNKGSEIVDMLGDFKLFQFIMGPAAIQLGTDANNITADMKPISGQIGIITGNSTSDPWFSPFIPGEDDGKVSVQSAQLDEMADFIIVDNGHTFIMRADIVLKQILHFLQMGKFAEMAN